VNTRPSLNPISSRIRDESALSGSGTATMAPSITMRDDGGIDHDRSTSERLLDPGSLRAET
jgi:hypothetical protein